MSLEIIMTLSTTQTKVAYKPDGSAKVFAVPFPVFDKRELRCSITDASNREQEITKFIVKGMGSPRGVYLHFFEAPPPGCTLVIFRDTRQVQESDYPEGGKFPSGVVENDFDRVVAMIQELQEELDRALKVPITSDRTPEEIMEELLALYALVEEYRRLVQEAMEQIAGVAGDSLVIANESTQPRKLRSRFHDILNVKDFGARGDGKHDDTSAFLSALAKRKPMFCPQGEYRVDTAKVDIDSLFGENAVLLTHTGSRIALRGPAQANKLAQIYFQEVRPTDDMSGARNAVMQAIGLADHFFFMTQSVVAPDGNWAYSESIRISQFPFQREATDNYDITNTDNAHIPEAYADLQGVGHGTGCSVINLEGERYIYTSVSVPKGTKPATDPVNYGTGFSKITWKGSQTTQEDVRHFYNLQDVREAEVAVSQDGRYVIFLSRNTLALEMFNNTTSSAWQIVVFDRKEVEASADPSSVKPLNKWDVSHIDDETASAHASGICSDGRYVYIVFSGAQNIGERSIFVYSLSGQLVRTIPVTGFASIALEEYKKGKGGKVVTAIEVEGLALYGDALVMGNKMTVHTPGDIVSFKGRNFINLTGSKGIRPYSWKDWARTEAKAFSGEYDHAKRYRVCTEPVYHKYMTALVPAGMYNREHEVCGSLYPTSHAAVNAFGPRASFAVHDHYAFTMWDRQTDSFLPVMQAMNDGSLRLYDPQGIKDDGAGPNSFGRVNYDYSEGLTLSGGLSVADSATIYLKNGQSDDAKYIIFYSGGDRTALMGPTHYTLFYGYIAPREDGVHPLGNVDRRWSEVRAASGTINTSDEREKDLIRDIPEKVFLAWEKVAYKEFVFKSALQKKGEQARKHMGLLAQQVKSAFESEGLDAFEYGLLCYDSWEAYEIQEDHPDGPELVEVSNADGTTEHVEKARTVSVTMPAGDRYGIRYDEALALEAAYLRWRLSGLSQQLESVNHAAME